MLFYRSQNLTNIIHTDPHIFYFAYYTVSVTTKGISRPKIGQPKNFISRSSFPTPKKAQQYDSASTIHTEAFFLIHNIERLMTYTSIVKPRFHFHFHYNPTPLTHFAYVMLNPFFSTNVQN